MSLVLQDMLPVAHLRSPRLLLLRNVDRAFACPYLMSFAGLWSSSRWCNAIRVRLSPCVKLVTHDSLSRLLLQVVIPSAWCSMALWFLPYELFLSKHIFVSTSWYLQFFFYCKCFQTSENALYLSVDLNFDSGTSSCSEKLKGLFNSRLEWKENYQRKFLCDDPKGHQGFNCVQTEPEPDRAPSFGDASSAFSCLSNFLLWNPKIYMFHNSLRIRPYTDPFSSARSSHPIYLISIAI